MESWILNEGLDFKIQLPNLKSMLGEPNSSFFLQFAEQSLVVFITPVPLHE
jgi:hypothetical protein